MCWLSGSGHTSAREQVRARQHVSGGERQSPPSCGGALAGVCACTSRWPCPRPQRSSMTTTRPRPRPHARSAECGGYQWQGEGDRGRRRAQRRKNYASRPCSACLVVPPNIVSHLAWRVPGQGNGAGPSTPAWTSTASRFTASRSRAGRTSSSQKINLSIDFIHRFWTDCTHTVPMRAAPPRIIWGPRSKD